ncbi:MAG: hypothetical protein H7319_10715 [Spirosoma sp.]|nr:hypothetical protein [Spirosoma sp.]
MLAIDYYPFIRGRIRRGKTANNFYHNPYITLEAWQPLSNATLTETSTGISYARVPFRQSLGLGVGLVSDRTRVFYYSASFTMAY